jgi:hypothetical protein
MRPHSSIDLSAIKQLSRACATAPRTIIVAQERQHKPERLLDWLTHLTELTLPSFTHN